MDKQKIVAIAQKVEALAIGFIGVFFFSLGTSYFRERFIYQVPRILIPVFDLLGNVGLAIAMLILGGGIIYYGFTKWKSASDKKSLYWILAAIGLVIGIALANINFNSKKQQEHETVTANPDDFIMKDILWSFTNGKYATQKQFIEDLVKYNLEIGKGEIDPDEIVIESNEVIIYYSYEEDDEQKDEEFHLTADNDKDFTAGELLYKIHNQVVEHLENLDYHFFEGLVNNGTDEQYPDIPYYYLNLGS